MIKNKIIFWTSEFSVYRDPCIGLVGIKLISLHELLRLKETLEIAAS